MDIPLIKSTANEKIKMLRKLYKRPERDKSGWFLMDGSVLVREALTSSAVVLKIFIEKDSLAQYSDIIKEAGNKNIPCYVLAKAVMESISQLNTPQGIIAIVEQQLVGFNPKALKHAKLLLALDRLQDPGNMGTIIRTADAVGADGIILGEGCVDVYNDKVIRSAMGSVLHLPIYRSKELSNNLADLKSDGWDVACGHLDGSDFYERQQADSVVLIIGNESKGVSDELLAVCSSVWKLPMYGRAESLNAAIAAGIMLYEIVRNN